MSEGHGTAGRRMALNAGARAAAEILVKVASLVLFAAVARTLGASTLGQYAFALAISQFIWAFSSLGLDRMTVREMARDHEEVHRVLFDAMAIKVATALVLTALAVSALELAGWDGETVLLVGLLGVDLCISLAGASAQTVFQAHERVGAYFVVAVPAGLLNAAFGLAVLASGGGIVALVLASMVAHLIGLALAWGIVYRRFARPRPRLEPRTWTGLVRSALPFGVQEMLGQLIFRFDTILLGVVATAAVLGQYSAAYRLLEATLFLAWSIGSSVLPQFSYLPRRGEAGGGASLEGAFEGASKLVLLAMAPIAAALLVCAPAVIETVYGGGYDRSIDVLRILAVAIVVYGIGHIVGLLILVKRPGRVSVMFNVAIAVLNVATCGVLIPLFEAEGAAIATLTAEAALALGGLVLAAPAIGRPRLRRFGLSPLVATTLMAAAMVPVAHDLWLALPIGAAVYVAALLVLEGRELRAQIAALRPA